MKVAAANQTVYKGPVHIFISANEEHKLRSLPLSEINIPELEEVIGNKVNSSASKGISLERIQTIELKPPGNTHIMPALKKGYIIESGQIKEIENKISPKEQEYLVIADDENNPSRVFILKHNRDENKSTFEIVEALEERESHPSKGESNNDSSTQVKPLQIFFGFKIDKNALETDWMIEIKKELVKSRLREQNTQYFNDRDTERARIDELARARFVISTSTTPKSKPILSVVDHGIGVVGEIPNGKGESWKEVLKILGVKGTLPALLKNASTLSIPQTAKPKIREWISENRGTELAMKLANNVELLFN